MSAVISPTTLQQNCEAAAATWLTEWSGTLGRVSARIASLHAGGPLSKQETHIVPISLPPSCKKDASALRISRSNCLADSHQEDHHATSKTEVSCQQNILKKQSKSCRCRKKSRKVDKAITIQYDKEVSSAYHKCDKEILSEYLGLEDHNTVSALPVEHETVNSHNRMINSNNVSSRVNFPRQFDQETIDKNVTYCSNFFRHYLPPVLIHQIIHLAWKQLSRLVALGSHNKCVQEYQVVDWTQRAPILLQLASKVSGRTFPLDISGIPDNMVEDVLNIVCHQFPLKKLKSFELPKANFKKPPIKFSAVSKDIYKSILTGSFLMSVTLNCALCDDTILKTLSQLSLKELEIGGNLVSEKGIVNGLCSLPSETASETLDIIESGSLQSYPLSPLRKSLQKFDMSFQSLSNVVYHIIPVIFSELLYYNPHRNMTQCIQNFVRLTRMKSNDDQHVYYQKTLNFLKINMGCPSRENIMELARTCPKLEEVSLFVNMEAENVLLALEKVSSLSRLEVTYYPSSTSSPPKLDAGVLSSVITKFKFQLQSLSLTGFSLPGNVLYALSQLPELYQLSLADCWVSNPRTMPENPFPSLEKLSLKFLPPNSTMQLLTMGGCLQTLHLDLKESEWEGNALTDANIKHLVTSGMIRSLQRFTASSSYLTLTSLKTLAALPCLKVVGYLASWGLTEEELRCVEHSGPQHVLCYQ